MTIKRTELNVRDFGAKGDYSKPQAHALGTGTDDSQAFKDVITAVINNTRRMSEFNDRGAQNVIRIPAGQYYITQIEAMLSSAYTTPVIGGLRFVGDGRFVTEIIYNPSTAGSYLLNNNNGFNFMSFENISFTSVGDITGVLNNGFMRSYSAGQAQNYIFHHCQWGGGWKEVLKIVGTDTNSEHSWYHCGFSGRFENAIYCPGSKTNGGDANNANEQMVNYNFFDTQFETTKGNYLNFQRGGSINIWGGSIMYYDGAATGGNGTFFTLGDTVNQGANRFHLEGVRMEMKSETAQLMNCKWRWGVVEFIGLDNTTQSYHPDNTNIVNTIIDFNGESGPIVSWINCQLQGKHRYIYGANAWQRKSIIRYQNCDLVHNNDINSFLSIVATGGNRGGNPVIQFEGTKSMMHNDPTVAMDCTFGWYNSTRGIAAKRAIKATSPDNMFPRTGGDQHVWLPLNAMITSISFVFDKTQTAVTTAGWQYFAKTGEGTTLHTATPISNNPANGMNSFADNINFICSSDAKRHIVVSCNGTVNADVRGIIMIEYIGG